MLTLPCAGFTIVAAVTVSGSPSGSLSLFSTGTLTPALYGAEAASSTAFGPSLTEVIVSGTVVGDEGKPSLSVTVNTRFTVPWKLAAGTNTRFAAAVGVSGAPATTGVVPSGRNSVPLVGNVVMVADTTVPSTSVPNSDTASGVSSGPLDAAGAATGGSLTLMTLIVTVAGSDARPSLSVTKKVMPVWPLKLAEGCSSRPEACCGVRVCPASTTVVRSASSSVLPGGIEITVTLATLPSPSVPVSGTGRVVSSLPLTASSSATGAMLFGSDAVPSTEAAFAGAPPSEPRLAGVTLSWMRSTRNPGRNSPPSPPFRPAAVAASGSFWFRSEITRSSSGGGAGLMGAATTAASSGVSWTMPSCVVRITSPRWTRSPIFSARI